METSRSNDSEARAQLQERLLVYAKIMVPIYGVLDVVVYGMYRLYPAIEPRHADAIQIGNLCGILVMAASWRLLVVRKLSLRALHAIDAAWALGYGLMMAVSGVMAADRSAASYMAVIYAYWAVFMRALVVPSSGRRTAVVTSILYAPIMVAGVSLAGSPWQELPVAAYIAGCALCGGAAVALAATGSRIIYGLRRQVRQAMQLGQYTLDRKIGEGGMGVVYLAHHALLRRPTAIKLIHPDKVGGDAVDRFEREVQHMSQLTHPNTVAVFDYGRSAENVFYYAMEYLGDGINLEELVHRYGPQPAGRVISILTQVCGALNEAHNRGIVHRDIKPANIILCERGDVSDVAKVVDFGLVKEIESNTGVSSQIVLGTPAYLAPEIVTDPSAISPAVDLYALGAVGYFLLVGRNVFEGKSAIETCIQQVTTTPRPPSQLIAVPADLEALIMACLAKLPAERPASAAAFARALRELASRGDWSDAGATAWWRAHQTAERSLAAVTVNSTITLAVDLQQRSDHRFP